jgi:hypothetical protein
MICHGFRSTGRSGGTSSSRSVTSPLSTAVSTVSGWAHGPDVLVNNAIVSRYLWSYSRLRLSRFKD